MPLPCTDISLPDIQTIPTQPSPSSLDDFCLILQPLDVESVDVENEVLLYETIADKNGKDLKYWAILEADESPIAVCELEKYADYAAKKAQWSGKRADYLIIGSHQSDCYLVVVELRHVLVKEEQEDKKFEQLRKSIEQIIQYREVIRNSQSLEQVYHDPDSYKILGVIIAPANTKKFNRR
ncbi:hypothetical protein, partial [Spirulina sp. 06S082]|uniref:hypothetical protein n=1 Tax=Spirulina sp. 06S082 TaxID=3110248 RepID=UPI002B21346E